MTTMDEGLFEAALIGLHIRKAQLEAVIADLQNKVGGKNAGPVPPISAERPRRRMSAAARKRIAAGQKKRWAERHTQKST